MSPEGESLPGPRTIPVLTRRCALDRFRRFLGPGVRNHHTDAGEAAKIGLPGPLAPGAMLAGYACEAVTMVFGDRWLSGGRLMMTYLAPVWDGDEIIVRLERAGAVDAVAGDSARTPASTLSARELRLETASGRLVVVGETSGGTT
jgi:acyl dehydratase